MADSHHAVSGYRENFPSETSAYIERSDSDSMPGHMDFQESNVYDRYARPGSSGAIVPVPPSQLTRPRTGQGHRVHRQPPVPTTSPEPQYTYSEEVISRPETSRGRRASEGFDLQSDEGVTRPGTSRGRRSSDTFDVSSEEGVTRPRTGRGRRSSEVLTLSSDPGDNNMEPLTPRSSKGRRSSQQLQHSVSPFDVDAVEGVTRPLTGRGRRTSLDVPAGLSPSPDAFDMTPRSQRSMSLQPSDPSDLKSVSPTTPRRPPSSQRPKSRYKNRSTRSDSHDSGVYDSRDMTCTPNSILSRGSRPGSSLSRYTPLPSISGRKSSMQDLEQRLGQMNLQDSSVGGENTRKSRPSDTIIVPNDREDGYEYHHSHHHDDKCSQKGCDVSEVTSSPHEDDTQTVVYKPLERVVSIPPEVPDGPERILLAIKLPSGNRVQRGFHASHKLSVVLNYAEVTAKLDFSGCELVCDVPRMVFSDMDLTIGASGLQNRTVLHIQVPDGH